MLVIQNADGMTAITVHDPSPYGYSWTWKDAHRAWWGGLRKAGWYDVDHWWITEGMPYMSDDEAMRDGRKMNHNGRLSFKPKLVIEFEKKRTLEHYYDSYEEAVAVANELATKHMVNVIRIGR